MPDPQLNPNAASNYLAVANQRQDGTDFASWTGRLSQLSPQDRAGELAKVGASEADYQAALSPQPPKMPSNPVSDPAMAAPEGKDKIRADLKNQAEAEHASSQAAGEVVGRLQSWQKGFEWAQHGLNVGGTAAYLMAQGIPPAQAVTGGAIVDKAQEMGADWAVNQVRKHFGPNHPVGEMVAGMVASIGTGIGMLGGVPDTNPPPAGASLEGAGVTQSGEGAGPITPDLEGKQYAPGTILDANGQPMNAPAAEGEGIVGPEDIVDTADEARQRMAGMQTPKSGPIELTQQQAVDQRVYTPEYNQQYLDAIDTARRGVRSRAMEHAEAAANPKTAEDLAAMQPGTAVNAADAAGLVRFEANETDTIQKLATRAIDLGDTDARAEALTRIDNLIKIHDPAVQGATAEAGRTLGVFNAPTSDMVQYLKAVRSQAMSRIGTPGYTDEDTVLKAFANATTPEQAAKLAQGTGEAGVIGFSKNTFLNTYISAMMSPQSIAAKIISDATNMAFQVPARALSEAAGYPLRALGVATENTITPGETLAMLRAIHDAYGDAFRIGWQSAVADKPIFNQSVGMGESMPRQGISSQGTWAQDLPVLGPGIDLYGHLISVPGRGLIGADQTAKVFQYRMEIGTLAQHTAYVDAMNQGLTGADAASYIKTAAAKFMDNPPQWAHEQAMDRAVTETFSSELNGELAAFEKYRSSSFLARLVIPFFKTPVNLTRMGIERTIPMSTEAYREAISNGGREAQLMIAKNALGAGISAYLIHAAANEWITGKGPDNPQINQMWRKSHEPYSIFMGNDENGNPRWVPTKNLGEPFAWTSGMIADSSYLHAHLDGDWATKLAESTATATAREIDRQTFWKGLSDATDTIEKIKKEGPSSKGLEMAAANFAASLVPGSIANPLQDPVRQKTEDFMDVIRKRFGIGTVPDRDPWGDLQVTPPGLLANELPMVKVVTKETSPADAEMVRLYHATGYVPPKVPDHLWGSDPEGFYLDHPNLRAGVSLTPQQQDELSVMRGGNGRLKKTISDMIKSKDYLNESDQERVKDIDMEFKSATRDAMDAITDKYPALNDQLDALQNQRDKRMDTPGPRPAGVPNIQ